jgi:hypothetical protein
VTGVELAVSVLFAAALAAWALQRRAGAAGTEETVADQAVWEAVHALGLSVPFDRYWPATGRLEGVALELAVVRRPDGPEGPGADRELVIRLLDPIPAPLLLRRGDRSPAPPAADLPIGESRFDALLRVQSRDEALARALLDAPTRDALAGAAQLGAGFADERLTLRAPCAEWTPAQVSKAVRATLRAHGALRGRLAAVRADPRAALNAVARTDRTAGVRLRCLDLLVRAGAAEVATLRSRAEDVDVSVRLLAAQALGPDGHPSLERLARTGSRTVRVRAAAQLATAATLAPDRAALVEDTFLAALDDPELVRAALLGLARRGTARSVPTLRASIARERRAEIRRLAEDALGAIRSRLDASAAGGMSLAEDPGGDLALAAAAGALAVGEDAGR